MLVAGDYVEYLYKGTFDYRSFCDSVWEALGALIRFPKETERDPVYGSVWEDMRDEETRVAVIDMLDRMGLPALDGRGGFIFVDALGYVECIGETGDDGKRYCTVALPVDGVICVRPADPEPA